MKQKGKPRRGDIDSPAVSPTNSSRQVAGRQRRRRFRRFKITLDFSQPRHWRNFLFALAGVNTFIVLGLVSGYKAYSYLESAEFCGLTCHPMEPQFVAYQRSAHANVDCVECHVGDGMAYYFRSKIDGLRQVYTLLTDTYSRPIKSPVHNLRPARETCEHCHTPASFKDNVVKTVAHYDNDEANTKVLSTFILKMGGWEASTGNSQGIHWHITNPVFYIPADEQRQVILWVGVQREDGSLQEYFARDMLQMAQTSFVEQARQNGEIRQMDCIDCHNRTAHDIPTPEEMIDKAIDDGLVSSTIPFIRRKAAAVLGAEYDTLAAAYQGISEIAAQYQTDLPEINTNQNEQILSAVDHLQQIYSSTNFPEMNLDWETNPNNEGHTPSLGCFRCHDGKHVSVSPSGSEVKSISASCNLCHTVPIIGRGSDLIVESPVIVGAPPASHAEFSWTIDHQYISETEKLDCYQCHGQGFCNNGVCHNLSHPPDMLFTHADEYRQKGNQVCYTCHQNINCAQCHSGGFVVNP